MWRRRERCIALKHGIELDEGKARGQQTCVVSTYTDERTVFIGGWTLSGMIEGASAQNKVCIQGECGHPMRVIF